jgi:hypothetical protein
MDRTIHRFSGSTIHKSGGRDVQCVQATSLGTGDRMTVAYADAHDALVETLDAQVRALGAWRR